MFRPNNCCSVTRYHEGKVHVYGHAPIYLYVND